MGVLVMVEITYHKEGDYFVPDLYLEKEDYEKIILLEVWSFKIRVFENYKKAEYIIMFMSRTLRKHIVETDKQAKQRFELLMAQMLEKILLTKI